MKSNNKEMVIALDLSKKSTGVAAVSNTQGKIKVEGLWTITSPEKEQYTKLEFFLIKNTTRELNIIIENILKENKNVSIALEYPVFGSHNYELGYYLMQEALAVADANNLDVVGYSPPLLKSFIKYCSYNQKYGGSLEKDQIRRIYEQDLYPINKNDLPSGSDINGSDEMDALFLGLMGLIIQAPYLRKFGELDIFKMMADLSFDQLLKTKESKELFLHGEYYMDTIRAKYLDLEGFKNIIFDQEHTPIYDQFKEIYKRIFTNEQLSLNYNYFFPMNKMTALSKIAEHYHRINEESFYNYIAVKMGISAKGVENKLNRIGNHRILFNKMGRLFIS